MLYLPSQRLRPTAPAAEDEQRLGGLAVLIGIFADAHDHLDNIRRAVERFNRERVDLVLFAGDFVSTIAVPPLRRLEAPLVACYGDNEGNKIGLASGFRLVGQLAEPPVRLTVDDGTRLVIAHMKRQLRGLDDYDVGVVGHTHKPRIERDARGRLLINPGETSGWSFGRPTIALFDTSTKQATIVELAPASAPAAPVEEVASELR
jgi:hypothetical protein